MEENPFLGCFSSLHQEIFSEILGRVDIKSLTRSKLVCKNWYKFISDPSIGKLYHSKKPSITGFFYKTSQTYQEKVEFVPIDTSKEFVSDPPSCLGFLDKSAVLYNSCNGLLHWSCSPEEHFISNPLTHKYVPLYWPWQQGVFAHGIAFDPSVSTDRFEIIALIDKKRVGVFSSETMQWAGVEAPNESTLVEGNLTEPYSCNQGLCLNGCLYWEMKKNALLEYNVGDQRGRVIDLPAVEIRGQKMKFDKPGCLGESGGNLSYCRVAGGKVCIWVVAPGESSSNPNANSVNWVRKYVISLVGDCIPLSPSFEAFNCQAIAMLEDCQGVLLASKGKIFRYRFLDNAMSEVWKVRRNGKSSEHFRMDLFFPFVHSLAFF